MNSIEKIKIRLFSVIPITSLHMIEFLKIVNIRFDDEQVSSAGITCSLRPELLLNKEFVDEYCKTDEHLFMLIMHELYHIILGHTHLFSSHEEIDNIAFDCIINALLCRTFPEEEYVSFFTSINPSSSFPGCLLRPVDENTPSEFVPLLKNLYFSNSVTYYEVYECIINKYKSQLIINKGGYLLLGDHSNQNEVTNPSIKKLLDEMISKWPREIIVKGRDLGGIMQSKLLKFQDPNKINQIKMKKLLKKAGINQGNVTKEQASITFQNADAVSFIPNYKDRLSFAKSLIYEKQLLYNYSLSKLQITKEQNIKTHVYLDVSGSVILDINRFASLLLKPYKNKECSLFTFSTKVVPISYKDFKDGKYSTTGGTNINCIFSHYFSLSKNKRPKKVLILTDGDVGSIDQTYYSKIKNEGIKLYFGLFGDITTRYIHNIAKYYEEFKKL